MAADWNAVRFDFKQSADHVESFYFKLNEPGGDRALWVKGTILSGLGRTPVAEAWSIVFDRQRGHVAVKEVVPYAEAHFSREHLDVRIAELVLAPGKSRGKIAHGADQVSWELEFDVSGEPMVPYPHPKMYEGPFPSQKTVTPAPDTRFSGWYRVNGREIRVDGWKGMQSHNWGKRHTELYAWGHVNQWDDTDELVLEGATGRLKLGPVLAPPLTVLCVWHAGRKYHFNEVRTLLRSRGFITPRSWRFEARNADARVHGELVADTDDMVGLRYENPNGELTYCLNSKIAWGLLVLEPTRGQRVHATTKAAALEIGTKDPSHGVRVMA